MTNNGRLLGASALAMVLLLNGCVTTQEGQEQAVGAAIGCLVVGGVTAAITRDARYAAAACAVGAAAGWATVSIQQYNARQARTSDADLRRYRRSDPDFYGLKTPVTTSAVRIRGVSASPARIKPGSTILAKTDYSVVTPPNQGAVSVTETWTLKKDGKTMTSSPVSQKRDGGGWQAEGNFTIPANAPTGTYIVEHKVQTGSSYDTRTSSFVVN